MALSPIRLNYPFEKFSETGIRGLLLTPNRTKLYIVINNGSNRIIKEYSLTDGDISTKVFQNDSVDLTTFDSNLLEPHDFKLNRDGTRAFIPSDSVIYQFDLTTPYDITTLTYNGVNFNTGETGVGGIDLTVDGKVLYVVRFSGAVENYDLSTPFDLSGVTSKTSTTFSVTSFDNLQNFQVVNNGRFVYVGGFGVSEVVKFKFGLNNDLTTLTETDYSYDLSNYMQLNNRGGLSDFHIVKDKLYFLQQFGDNNEVIQLTTHQPSMTTSLTGCVANLQHFNFTNDVSLGRGNNFTTLYSFNYTPSAPGNEIIIQSNSNYRIGGSNVDSHLSRLAINDNGVVTFGKEERHGTFRNERGGGRRSATIQSPIGVLSNISGNTINVSFQVNSQSTDDTITFFSAEFLVTEIER